MNGFSSKQFPYKMWQIWLEQSDPSSTHLQLKPSEFSEIYKSDGPQI